MKEIATLIVEILIFTIGFFSAVVLFLWALYYIIWELLRLGRFSKDFANFLFYRKRFYEYLKNLGK